MVQIVTPQDVADRTSEVVTAIAGPTRTFVTEQLDKNQLGETPEKGDRQFR
jgi:hypothetical protein